MKPINLINFTFRQIQIFLAVADMESQTNASQYLHVSQPMISKSLAQLEHELGLTLFTRGGKISLTPAGRVLFMELKGLSGTIEKAVLKAREKQAGLDAPLVIGFPPFVDTESYIMPLLDQYAARQPGFQYRLEPYEIQRLPVSLLSGDVDAIITGIFDQTSLARLGLRYRVLLKTRVWCYMRKTNPLARKKTVKIEDLSAQNILALSPNALPSYFDNFLLPMFARKGLRPNVVYTTQSSESLAANLKNDNDVFLCDDIFREVEGTKKVPVDGEEHRILIAWRPGANEAIIRMAETISID